MESLSEKMAANPAEYDFSDIPLPKDGGGATNDYTLPVMLGGFIKRTKDAKVKVMLAPLGVTMRPLKLRQQREIAKIYEALSEDPTSDEYADANIAVGTHFLIDANGKNVTADWVMDNLNAIELDFLTKYASGQGDDEGE